MNVRRSRAVPCFTAGSEGTFPVAGLVADSLGNLYGTTRNGGASSEGIVFQPGPTIPAEQQR